MNDDTTPDSSQDATSALPEGDVTASPSDDVPAATGGPVPAAPKATRTSTRTILEIVGGVAAGVLIIAAAGAGFAAGLVVGDEGERHRGHHWAGGMSADGGPERQGRDHRDGGMRGDRYADGMPGDRHADGMPGDRHADGMPGDRHHEGMTPPPMGQQQS